MHRVPFLNLLYADKSFSGMHSNLYPMAVYYESGMRITTVCNILHECQKLKMQLILHILHMYKDIHTQCSAPAESCLNIHLKTSK